MVIYDDKYFYNVILEAKKEDAIKAIVTKSNYYKSFTIPKKDGRRRISALNRGSDLYQLHKNLVKNFFSKIPLPTPTKGFIEGESYNTYLIAHCNHKYYMRVDIKSFFDTITREQIQNELVEFVKLEEVRNVIGDLCTLEGVLPQGTVASPVLSNIVFRRLDQRILKYCQAYGVTYTRYADDMMFSSNKVDFKEKRFFYHMIAKILRDNGFKSNYSKKRTEEMGIALSGFVVKEDVHLSRKKMKNINKILYFFRKDKVLGNTKFIIDESIKIDDNLIRSINDLKLEAGTRSYKEFRNKNELVNYLCGMRAYIIGVIKVNEASTS